MTRTALINLLAYLGLGTCVIATFLYAGGVGSSIAFKWALFAGSILWFGMAGIRIWHQRRNASEIGQ